MSTRLRRLLTAPATEYSFLEIKTITGLSEEALLATIKEYDIQCADEIGERFSWEETVSIITNTFPPTQLDALLGKARLHLPPLVRLTTVTLALPTYLVKLLEYLTSLEPEHVRVSDYLARHLQDLASTHDTPAVEANIPGYHEALHYPTPAPTKRDVTW